MRRHRRPGAIYDLERGLDYYVAVASTLTAPRSIPSSLTLETRVDWAFDKFW
ncbi:hypothetical protein Pcac1_g20854 [Phytophthora cactorum]|nr:hypothetical protein Pcac1_g20854 [Phytophthora cactorum]